MATLQGESSSYVKPKTLKECIIRVLQEAGPGGLTLKEFVQRIKKKKWWDWKKDEQGYHSVASMCCEPRNSDVFVRVAPGTWALLTLQDDDFKPYMELKECIISVLQEAGPGGLTIKEIVQRIKKKFSWDWKSDRAGYDSVAKTCPRRPDVFIKYSPGVYALKSLQGGEAEGSSKTLAREKPKSLKEAIIIVLQEAGPKGLKCKDIWQRIKEEELLEWKNEKSGSSSVSQTCSGSPSVFVKHSHGVYALKSLQGGEGEAEGSSQALAREKAENAERTASGSAKRARKAADGPADESTEKKKQKMKTVAEHIAVPQKSKTPVEDRRLILFTEEQSEAADLVFQRAFEEARQRMSRG